MDWVLRNISLLALALVLATLAGELFKIFLVFGRARMLDATLMIGTVISVAFAVTLIAIGYGVLLRFLQLCDDVAALRDSRNATPSRLE
jgi:hypothetical protein